MSKKLALVGSIIKKSCIICDRFLEMYVGRNQRKWRLPWHNFSPRKFANKIGGVGRWVASTGV